MTEKERKRGAGGSIGCLMLLSIPILLGGLAALWFGVRDYRLMKEVAPRLKPVKAVIVESHVERQSSGRRGTGGGTAYFFRVKFRYEVGGKTYESDDYELGMESSRPQADCEELARRYRSGVETTAYYDPENPSFAVLNPEVGSGYIVVMLLGFVFVLVGLGLALGPVMTGRREKRMMDEFLASHVLRPSPHPHPVFFLVPSALLVVGFPALLLPSAKGTVGAVAVWGFVGLAGLVILTSLRQLLLLGKAEKCVLYLEEERLRPGGETKFAIVDPEGFLEGRAPDLTLVNDRGSSRADGGRRFVPLGEVKWEMKDFRGQKALAGTLKVPKSLIVEPYSGAVGYYKGLYLRMKLGGWTYLYPVPLAGPEEG